MKEIGLKDNPNSVTPFNVFLEGTNFILKIKVYKLIKSHEYIKGHIVREPLTIWPQLHIFFPMYSISRNCKLNDHGTAPYENRGYIQRCHSRGFLNTSTF